MLLLINYFIYMYLQGLFSLLPLTGMGKIWLADGPTGGRGGDMLDSRFFFCRFVSLERKELKGG